MKVYFSDRIEDQELLRYIKGTADKGNYGYRFKMLARIGMYLEKSGQVPPNIMVLGETKQLSGAMPAAPDPIEKADNTLEGLDSLDLPVVGETTATFEDPFFTVDEESAELIAQMEAAEKKIVD